MTPFQSCFLLVICLHIHNPSTVFYQIFSTQTEFLFTDRCQSYENMRRKCQRFLKNTNLTFSRNEIYQGNRFCPPENKKIRTDKKNWLVVWTLTLCLSGPLIFSPQILLFSDPYMQFKTIKHFSEWTKA